MLRCAAPRAAALAFVAALRPSSRASRRDQVPHVMHCTTVRIGMTVSPWFAAVLATIQGAGSAETVGELFRPADSAGQPVKYWRNLSRIIDPTAAPLDSIDIKNSENSFDSAASTLVG